MCAIKVFLLREVWIYYLYNIIITNAVLPLKHKITTLTVTPVFKEISVGPRVPQYQAFSARYSHRYFSNASRSSGSLKNDLSFRLFAIFKSLAVVEYNEGKCGIDYSDQIVQNQMVQETWRSTSSGNFCCKRFDSLQNRNKEGYILFYYRFTSLISISLLICLPPFLSTLLYRTPLIILSLKTKTKN